MFLPSFDSSKAENSFLRVVTLLNQPSSTPSPYTHTHSKRCTFHYCRMSYLRAKRKRGEKTLWEQQIWCLQPFKKNPKGARFKAWAAALITAELRLGTSSDSAHTEEHPWNVYYGKALCNNVNAKHTHTWTQKHTHNKNTLNSQQVSFPFKARGEKKCLFFSGNRRRRRGVWECVFK